MAHSPPRNALLMINMHFSAFSTLRITPPTAQREKRDHLTLKKISHKLTARSSMPDQIMFKLCMRRMRLRRAGPPTGARTVFGICHPSAALSRKIWYYRVVKKFFNTLDT